MPQKIIHPVGPGHGGITTLQKRIAGAELQGIVQDMRYGDGAGGACPQRLDEWETFPCRTDRHAALWRCAPRVSNCGRLPANIERFKD
jgi:hypothetical protein